MPIIALMIFQEYLENIRIKTGKTPEDFRRQMKLEGIFKPDMKASVVVDWLKDKYDLGLSHAMAVWAVFKSEGWLAGPNQK